MPIYLDQEEYPVIQKQPAEVKFRTLDISAWLCEDEYIADARAYPNSNYDENVVTPPLDLAKLIPPSPLRAFAEAQSNPGNGTTEYRKNVSLVVTNGEDGEVYVVQIIFDTTNGRREEVEVTVNVNELN